MTVDEMEDTLESLGIEVLSTRGDELQARCPAHKDRTGKEDHNPSWFINADTGAHICFSCQFKGSLMYLIGYINKYYDEDGNINFKQASEWLNQDAWMIDRLERAINNTPKKDDVSAPIDRALLAAFKAPPEYALQSRGLTRAAAELYNILWDDMRKSWIIPILDPNDSSLLGWQEKAYYGRFFKNYPTGVKKSNALFGVHTYTADDLIVVESPLDAVRLASVGVLGGVATYGSLLSNKQISLIKNADRIIFAFDNDDAGIAAKQKMLRTLEDMWFEAWFFDYSHTNQKDVGGMSKDEIMVGLKNARHCVALRAEGM